MHCAGPRLASLVLRAFSNLGILAASTAEGPSAHCAGPPSSPPLSFQSTICGVANGCQPARIMMTSILVGCLGEDALGRDRPLAVLHRQCCTRHVSSESKCG